MLSHQQIELIQSTVPILRENGTALTQHFYRRLFRHYPQLKNVFNATNQATGAQSNALAFAVLAYAENINDPSVLIDAVRFIAHKHASLNVQASDYAIVGEQLLASISEVLAVDMESDLIQAWALAFGQLADLFIQTEAEIYQSHQQQGWLGWRKFKVSKKVKESLEISSFYLEASDGGQLPNYKPGQYISLRVFVPELGLMQPRQYTLSDQPNPNQWRISVKHETAGLNKAEGLVSHQVHQLQVGDEIELTHPTGLFYLVDNDQPQVLISGGVGLTPMISILNHLLSHDHSKPIHFLHACRNGQVQAMKQHIQQLQKDHLQLKTLIAYEQPDSTDILGQDYDIKGLLHLDQLNHSWLPADANYYLCGPSAFMQQQKQSLLSRGVAAAQIHTEYFTTDSLAKA